MSIETELSKRLGLDFPIIQAPMAGGTTTPALVAAVSQAGGLGFVGAAYLDAGAIADQTGQVRARTNRGFGVNLFAPLPEPEAPADMDPALATVAAAHQELGLEGPDAPSGKMLSFEEQMQGVLDSGASVFSFTFGIVSEAAIVAAKARGMFVMGTATTVDEALLLEAAGVDAVVAQGSEAGAHRGTFAVPFEEAMIGTMALVPQVVDAVKVPVVASGGIMDGRGIAAALVLGASAVQMGTAFLTTRESGTSEAHKRAILSAKPHQTKTTTAFSGRNARGIVNRFMREAEGRDGAILPYPMQNALTRAMRSEAGKQGKEDYLSLWAGQGLGMARNEAAADLVARLVAETEAALRRVLP